MYITLCRTRIKFSAGIDRHPRSRAPDTDQTKETMTIIDRSLIHKYIVMAITDRPAAHEHLRSFTTIFYPSNGRTCRAKETDCANQQASMACKWPIRSSVEQCNHTYDMHGTADGICVCAHVHACADIADYAQVRDQWPSFSFFTQQRLLFCTTKLVRDQ